MHRNTIIVGAAIVALGTVASAGPLTDNALELDIPGFLAAQSLQPINLADQSPLLDTALTGPGGNSVNQLVSDFSGPFDLFSGTLISTVYANQSLPGLGVNQVAIIYEFIANGDSPIDLFNFGVDTGQSISYDAFVNAIHGRLLDSTTTGRNVNATAFENFDPFNSFVEFDFAASGGGPLGLTGNQERLTWYVLAGGDVRVNVVDVSVSDGETASAKALAFTTTPDQDDLNVPAPGAAVLGVMAIGLASRRRR